MTTPKDMASAPEVRAAVLDSLTVEECRHLAKTHRLLLRIVMDEVMSGFLAPDPALSKEWSEFAGTDSGTLTAEHAALGPRYSNIAAVKPGL